MWAKPRAAPPPRARPMRGRRGGGAGATATGGGAGGTGAGGGATGALAGVLAQPARPSSASEPTPAANAIAASRRFGEPTGTGPVVCLCVTEI